VTTEEMSEAGENKVGLQTNEVRVMEVTDGGEK